MLQLAILLFVFAVIAGVLGFSGIAAGFATLAKVCFVLFLGLFVITLVGHAFRGATQ